MSALRINVPGEPVRHIDLGPANGRVTHHGTRGSIGGELVQPRPAVNYGLGTPVARRQQMAAYKARIADPCGRLMRTGESCARRRGHKDQHYSAAFLLRDAEQRRARKGFSIHPENRR